MGRVEGEAELEINEVEVVFMKEPDDCLCKVDRCSFVIMVFCSCLK